MDRNVKKICIKYIRERRVVVGSVALKTAPTHPQNRKKNIYIYILVPNIFVEACGE